MVKLMIFKDSHTALYKVSKSLLKLISVYDIRDEIRNHREATFYCLTTDNKWETIDEKHIEYIKVHD